MSSTTNVEHTLFVTPVPENVAQMKRCHQKTLTQMLGIKNSDDDKESEDEDLISQNKKYMASTNKTKTGTRGNNPPKLVLQSIPRQRMGRLYLQT